MLIGEYKAKFQEKNRVALPVKFREHLRESLIITRGYEGCLIILDISRWKELIKAIEIKPLTNQDVRNTKRFLVGGADEIKLDLQGRFIVNEPLQIYANLSKEVMFVGLQDWVELWNLEVWEKKIAEISKSAADIGDRLTD